MFYLMEIAGLGTNATLFHGTGNVRAAYKLLIALSLPLSKRGWNTGGQVIKFKQDGEEKWHFHSEELH